MAEVHETCDKNDEKRSYRSSIDDGGFKDLSRGDDDDAVLRANGHAAAMPRQFTWISALGLAFSIINSWVGYLVCDIECSLA